MPDVGIAQADDGGVHMAILLSQPQFLQIANAAACLYPGDRDSFIAAVAAELHGLPIGDGRPRDSRGAGEILPSRAGAVAGALGLGQAALRARIQAPILGRRAMAYWAAAQLQPQRDGLALHCLRQAGFETYAPRLRERRTVVGRKVIRTPLLFPGYLFVLIKLQWHTARWSPGVVRLIMDGLAPAVVPDAIIAEIRSRETGGLIELPPRLKRGDRVRLLRGPFAGHVGLYAGMKPHERVEV